MQGWKKRFLGKNWCFSLMWDSSPVEPAPAVSLSLRVLRSTQRVFIYVVFAMREPRKHLKRRVDENSTGPVMSFWVTWNLCGLARFCVSQSGSKPCTRQDILPWKHPRGCRPTRGALRFPCGCPCPTVRSLQNDWRLLCGVLSASKSGKNRWRLMGLTHGFAEESSNPSLPYISKAHPAEVREAKLRC